MGRRHVDDDATKPCALCRRTPVIMRVLDPSWNTDDPDLVDKPIDACIADIVEALNAAGIPTRTSCCGHGVGLGWILLRDGRQLDMTEAAVRSLPRDDTHDPRPAICPFRAESVGNRGVQAAVCDGKSRDPTTMKGAGR